MPEEKIKRTFEVVYYDLNKQSVTVPISAHQFTFRSNHLVFLIHDEEVVAFKEWVFVRRVDPERKPMPPSSFTDEQLKLFMKKHPAEK